MKKIIIALLFICLLLLSSCTQGYYNYYDVNEEIELSEEYLKDDYQIIFNQMYNKMKETYNSKIKVTIEFSRSSGLNSISGSIKIDKSNNDLKLSLDAKGYDDNKKTRYKTYLKDNKVYQYANIDGNVLKEIFEYNNETIEQIVYSIINIDINMYLDECLSYITSSRDMIKYGIDLKGNTLYDYSNEIVRERIIFKEDKFIYFSKTNKLNNEKEVLAFEFDVANIYYPSFKSYK